MHFAQLLSKYEKVLFKRTGDYHSTPLIKFATEDPFGFLGIVETPKEDRAPFTPGSAFFHGVKSRDLYKASYNELEQWIQKKYSECNIKTKVSLVGVTRFQDDYRFFGSFSFNGIKTCQNDRVLISSRFKNIFFAGEATSQDAFGTVHGAYVSGIRAAKEIMSI